MIQGLANTSFMETSLQVQNTLTSEVYDRTYCMQLRVVVNCVTVTLYIAVLSTSAPEFRTEQEFS